MDSRACKNLCGKAKESCLISSEKMNKDIIIMGVNKDVFELLDAAESNGSLVIITHDANRENEDFCNDLQSPLTAMKKPFKLYDIDFKYKENNCKVAALIDNGSPKTPEDGGFDPFTHDPEIMA